MSPSVGNFVHDLVEMAKAMETLPQVQAENDRLHNSVEDYAKQVQDREISIINLKNEIEALNNRVRDAEVARDDAELRFLELDEKAGKVLSSLGNIQANLNDAVNGLTPPKPEPQPEPEPIKDHAADELAAKPFDWPEAAPQDQSEPHPTTATESSGSSQGAPTPNVESTTGADTTNIEEPKHRPFSGKFYYDHPVYVSLQNWIEGGGTEENYYRSKPQRDDTLGYPI